MSGAQDRYVNNVIFEMNNVNELTDQLYESMMDKESSEVVRTINQLKYRLSEIQRSYKQ